MARAPRDNSIHDGDSWSTFEGDLERRMVGGWPLGVLRNTRGPMDHFGGGPISGNGQTSYRVRDQRIQEDISERLTRHGFLDAHDLEVLVDDGEVTLLGFVPEHQMERLVEDVAASVHGVTKVVNRLRVRAVASASPDTESEPFTRR